MKILLIGEFSSLHKFLKEGLLYCDDVEVKLLSQGDGWKEIGGTDYTVPTLKGRNIFFKIEYYFQYINLIRKQKGYDVVQLISTNIFPPLISNFLFNILKRNNKMISLVSAGNQLSTANSYLEGKFEYHPFDFDKSYLNVYVSKNFKNLFKKKCESYIEKNVDIIIPSLYEYSFGHLNDRVYDVIPFPINTASIQYVQNKVDKKIVFFHGLNREKMKGTPLIREAMEKLLKDYPDDVEIIIKGHMPFKEYTEIMKKANVVVDQCCTYGYGINACIAMAQGKIVMSGCRKETLESFYVEDSPMIMSKPSVEYLYNQMCILVNNKSEITEMGKLSRAYVDKLHDFRVVAKKYIKAWKSTGKV